MSRLLSRGSAGEYQADERASLGYITWVPLPSGFKWVEQKLGTGVGIREEEREIRTFLLPSFSLLWCYVLAVAA